MIGGESNARFSYASVEGGNDYDEIDEFTQWSALEASVTDKYLVTDDKLAKTTSLLSSQNNSCSILTMTEFSKMSDSECSNLEGVQDDISTPSGSSYSNNSESVDENDDDDVEANGDREGGNKIPDEYQDKKCKPNKGKSKRKEPEAASTDVLEVHRSTSHPEKAPSTDMLALHTASLQSGNDGSFVTFHSSSGHYTKIVFNTAPRAQSGIPSVAGAGKNNADSFSQIHVVKLKS
ncbi:hypothetical protein BD410DRAFT_809681 [Rickenella mellea]|uniref:Uncharacterized protein n=1 Tax=Rickenella mellea TaxID=50990 RepID=A0A4Y7PGC5_9AGAM|nr:hypothetical protein BD410DRAFT_809681 [Rickenella mellea]